MNYKRKRAVTLLRRMNILVCLACLSVSGGAKGAYPQDAWTQDEENEATLKVHFDFSSAQDLVSNFTGSLENGAELRSVESLPVLDLGANDGYFDLGSGVGSVISGFDNFTISTNIYVPSSTSLSGNGNFIWTFANSDNMASTRNGCAFMRANDVRYAITRTYYSSEVDVVWGSALPTGYWVNLTYTQDNGEANLYLDGTLVRSGEITLALSALGNTSHNYLGRSCYTGDLYLQGAIYNDFRMYEGALSEDSIAGLCRNLTLLTQALHLQELETALEELLLPTESRENLVLPVVLGESIKVSWLSSDETVLTSDGRVIRPASGEPAVTVTLTVTLTKGSISVSQDYTIRVIPRVNDAESVIQDLDNLVLTGTENRYDDLSLPKETVEGSILTWESSEPDYLTREGRVVKLPPHGAGKKEVILTATAVKGEAEASRDFTVYVAEDENHVAYLFSYFTGNSQSQEQIRFALSVDGYNYTPLNNGERIISSDTIALKQGVRDPHILRGEDGNTFYMVVTDMKSSEGWSSNDGLVLLKSDDLINWTHQAIDFPDTWPSRFDRQALTQVWAPQTIYDPVAQKYAVYYSIGEDGQHYKIYYSYANTDFTELEQPQLLYDHGSNTIDADIVYKDGLYHMFFKTEGEGSGIQKATAPTLQGPWTANNTYLQQTTVAVEGSGVFKKINSNEWVLMYDCYTSGYYQFCKSTDLEEFTWVYDTETSNDFSPRHGTVLPITQEEAERLVAKWPSYSLSPAPLGADNRAVRTDYVEIDATARTIYLPVAYGTDLSAFDPQLYGFAGTAVTPSGAQDFTHGEVDYTFSLNASSAVYSVQAELLGNPVLTGFYADPEILYSQKTGRFYLYPTTDGYSGWSSSSFSVFSSPDLVHWTDEGTILDLSGDQVVWANGYAWAPAIEEKEEDGNYTYYYYYSGNTNSGKQIGVAISASPSGPFRDYGVPIITTSPTGSGQQIDVDAFTDPVSGKSYLYWGNGYMAGAELNEDRVSLKEGTTVVLTPAGGSLETYAYREAPYVFYRNGLYYFMWSVDDTGSVNYHVAYGTSSSPLGPITVAKDPIVLIQDPANGIYGSGHNSVIRIPGRDEWYIVYHRINEKYRNNGPGYHREVCIDRLYFNTDGTLRQVVPTRQGIDPVDPFDPDVAIGTVPGDESEAFLLSVDYYDTKGIYWGSEADLLPRGIYLRRSVYQDGSVKGEKFVNP